jgi:glucose-1-phosphatase
MNDSAFDALLFDLGGVVIDIDFRRAIARWAEASSTDAALLQPRLAGLQARVSGGEVYRRHETGKLTDEAFFDSLRAALEIDIADADLLDGWNAIFVGEIFGISGLLAAAAARLPLYAFSNSNPAHQAYFSRRFASALSHFKQVFVSSDVGLRKPDAEAFQFVIRAINVPAERILFFDDSAANVEGARACGLHAIHVTTHSTVADTLARII